MQSVGIVAHCGREAALACSHDLLARLEGHGARVLLPADLAAALGRSDLAVEPFAPHDTDLLVALGGDGTLLAASRIAAPAGVPVLGVHVGGPASFGFLTEVTPDSALPAIDRVLAGDYHVESRLMAAAAVRRAGEPDRTYHGLNDLVIRAQARMMKLRVSVGSTFIATYAADGIIVATPTGSTAYNLAAGGPLVHPRVETLLLTPICSHTLNVRSLLVGVEDVIHTRLESGERDRTLLTIDGQQSFPLERGDEVDFFRSRFQARFVSLDGGSFYQKVQTRLRLGERFGS